MASAVKIALKPRTVTKVRLPADDPWDALLGEEDAGAAADQMARDADDLRLQVEAVKPLKH